MKRVLIVEQDAELGRTWARHIERSGAKVTTVRNQRSANEAMRLARFDALVVDLALPEGSALAVSEFAAFWQPEARVVFVTRDNFFSGGSIFAFSENARAFLPSNTSPEDLAAIVEYHAASR